MSLARRQFLGAGFGAGGGGGGGVTVANDVWAEGDGMGGTSSHFWMAIALGAMLAAHIAGAVYHHAVRRDDTLRRMA